MQENSQFFKTFRKNASLLKHRLSNYLLFRQRIYLATYKTFDVFVLTIVVYWY
jgi:hypothetical protein